MGTVFTVVAILGLILVVVGATVWFVGRPKSAVILVIGAVVYAVAQLLLLFDSLV